MDNRDFSNIGEQIRESVQSAIESMDFKQLNRTITDTVNSALEEAKRQLSQGAGARGAGRRPKAGPETYGPGAYEDVEYRECTVSEEEVKPKEKAAAQPPPKAVPVKVRQVGRLAGVLCTVFGGIGLGLTSALLLAMLFLALMARPIWEVIIAGSAVLAVLGGGCGILLGYGNSLRGRLKRLKSYLAQAEGKTYCSIQDLAKSLGKSTKFVAKDLKKMIARGILPEAHLDDKETCLMLDEVSYQQYQQAQEALKQREQQDRLKKEAPPDAPPTELDYLIEEGKQYSHILREANDAISGQVISAKLDRLEMVIRRIFESVEKHPKQMDEMQKFMEYYLPTTIKLVNAYRDFDGVEVQGENLTMAKREIEQTLDTINQAFERLLDDLYQDAALDVSTDASVLQTMLKKDGWADSDFDRRKE